MELDTDIGSADIQFFKKTKKNGGLTIRDARGLTILKVRYVIIYVII